MFEKSCLIDVSLGAFEIQEKHESESIDKDIRITNNQIREEKENKHSFEKNDTIDTFFEKILAETNSQKVDNLQTIDEKTENNAVSDTAEIISSEKDTEDSTESITTVEPGEKEETSCGR